MGLGGIGFWPIVLILVVVVLVFGTSKLKNVGSDLGSALKGFKKSMREDDDVSTTKQGDADFDSLEKPEQNATTGANHEAKKQSTKE